MLAEISSLPGSSKKRHLGQRLSIDDADDEGANSPKTPLSGRDSRQWSRRHPLRSRGVSPIAPPVSPVSPVSPISPLSQASQGSERSLGAIALPPLTQREQIKWWHRKGLNSRPSQSPASQRHSHRKASPTRSPKEKPSWESTCCNLGAGVDVHGAWLNALRHPEIDAAPSDWQERKHRHRRRTHTLSKLRDRQLRWRQGQARKSEELAQKLIEEQGRPSSRLDESSGRLQSCADDNHPSSARPDSKHESPNQSDFLGSPCSADQTEELRSEQELSSEEEVWFTRMKGEASARSSDRSASRSYEGSGSTSNSDSDVSRGQSRSHSRGSKNHGKWSSAARVIKCGRATSSSRASTAETNEYATGSHTPAKTCSSGATCTSSENNSQAPSVSSSKRSSMTLQRSYWCSRGITPDGLEEFDKGQTPILEEESGEGDTPPRTISTTIEAWEDLRVEFESEILDALSDLYQGTSSNAVAQQMVDRKSWNAAAAIMNIPCRYIHDQLTQQRKVPVEESLSLYLLSLYEFLSVCSAALATASVDNAMLFCGRQEIEEARKVCMVHSNSANKVPMTRLLRAIVDLSCDSEFSNSEFRDLEQQWLLEALRECNMAVGPRASTRESFSIDDVVRLAYLCNQKKRRHWRSLELAEERRLRLELGYSFLEMEDMRELHRSYEELEIVARGGHPGQRLATLLSVCAKRVSQSELDTLDEIVALGQPSAQPEPSQISPFQKASPPARAFAMSAADVHVEKPSVSFQTFVQWMTRIFELRIGGVRRNKVDPEACLDVSFGSQHRGFSGALLRELGRRERAAVADQAWSSPADEDATQGDLNHPVSCTPPPTKRSLATSSCDVARPSTSARVHLPLGTPSVSVRSPAATFQVEEVDQAACASMVVKKGLPPSETMLGRRLIRACSIDLSGGREVSVSTPAATAAAAAAAAAASAVAAAASSSSPQQQQQETDNIRPIAPCRVPSEAVVDRKVKPVQDSDSVIRGAILKLEALNPTLDANNIS